MNKQQLRACFDSIRPSEALIEKTMKCVRERQEQLASAKEMPVRRMPRYAFATRLASAACALVLLVGIGITVGKNAVTAPSTLPGEDERSAAPMTLNAEGGEHAADEPSNGGTLVGCEDMIATAEAYAVDWVVFSATVEAMYFVNESEGVVALRPDTVADKRLSTEQPGWLSEGEQTLAAHVDLTDADWQAQLLNSVGGQALVGMHAEQREDGAVWVIHELYPEVAPVQ